MQVKPSQSGVAPAMLQVPQRAARGGCSCLPRGCRSTDMHRWRRESRPCGSVRAASIWNSAPPRRAFRHAAVETELGHTPLWPAPPRSWGKFQTEMMNHRQNQDGVTGINHLTLERGGHYSKTQMKRFVNLIGQKMVQTLPSPLRG